MSRAKASTFLTAEVTQSASWYKKMVGELIALKPSFNKENPYYWCAGNKKKSIRKDHVRIVILVRIMVCESWYKSLVGQTLLVYADSIEGFYQARDTKEHLLVQHCDIVTRTQVVRRV